MANLKLNLRYFICFFLFGLTFAAHAQNCYDFEPDRKDHSKAYQPRKGDVRCEGLIKEKVSIPDQFKLHRLQIGTLYYERQPDEVLRVFVPGRLNQGVSVVGSGFDRENSTNYRLDMELQKHMGKNVPVAAVLNEFKPSLIGFYGRISGGNIYCPVSVTTTSYPEKDRETMILGLRCGRDLKDLRCEYSISKKGDCLKSIRIISMPKGFQNEEVQFNIVLNTIPEIKSKEVDLCVYVYSKDAETGKDLMPFSINIKLPQL